jgi:hypothetical protein
MDHRLLNSRDIIIMKLIVRVENLFPDLFKIVRPTQKSLVFFNKNLLIIFVIKTCSLIFSPRFESFYLNL